ncbi:globin domain-containing protein [Brevirhabdus sp.]|uniref:globin domain-containing protein n=1 Tax=Brevirhabdus sp. TaxID=2004514 RepID=UPI004058C166
MNEEQITRIRRSWALVASDRQTFARVFYAELFRLAPETRALFKPGMEQQIDKLSLTLAFIVDHLDQPDPLNAEVRKLGALHRDLHVTPAQYGPAGQALLAAFGEILGPVFSAQDARAWAAAYELLAREMQHEPPPGGATGG